jgi:hypothetical protein
MGSKGLCLHLDDIARDLSNPFLEKKLRQTSDRLMLSDPVTLVTFCEDDSLPYLLWSEFSVHKLHFAKVRNIIRSNLVGG